VRVWFDPDGEMLEAELGKPRKGFFKDAGDDVFLRVNTKRKSCWIRHSKCFQTAKETHGN
jgi:hypothetical protein